MEVINYNRSSVSLTNSILKYFEIKPFHETLREVDNLLIMKKYKNIVILVLDGLGSKNLNICLEDKAFLRRKKYFDISTVFPPTTVASTTSILTGLFPSEHNWLGWNMYFKDTDETISLYNNKDKITNNNPKKNVFDRDYMKYNTIVDLIRRKGKDDSYYAYPFDLKNPCYTLEEVLDRVEMLTKDNKKKFIYAYIENPDHLMHEYGIYSNLVKKEVNIINEKLEQFSKKIKDTIIFVTADHGLIPTKYINLKKNIPELYSMLERTTSIESRACGIKIKNNVRKEDFIYIYNTYLKDSFLLFTYEEVVKKGIFGYNTNQYLKDSIGDYLLVATGNFSINYDDTEPIFKAAHAGLTRAEMTVPLIIIDSK